MAVGASQEREVGKKFDVGEGADLPALTSIPGVARVGEPHAALLEAVYFDTAGGALASRRITLRRGTGGADAGWLLLLPTEPPSASGAPNASGTGPRQRRELHAPLGQADVVPESLLVHLHGYLRGVPVAPVVRWETSRTIYPLYGGDGLHLADLADDRVTAGLLPAKDEGREDEGREASHPEGAEPQRWREWELKLVHGDAAILGPAEELLARAGARPAGRASKLARAMIGGESSTLEGSGTNALGGRVTGGAAEGSSSGPLGKNSPAAAVVTVYLAAQVQQLLTHDPAVRLEEPDAVHNMRSAARRLRSVLAAYRKLYLGTPLRSLRDELKWLGQLLGGPRDAEVLLERLRRQLAELPPGEEVEALGRAVEKKAGAMFDESYRLLLEAMGRDRYFRLLDSLEQFRDHPPVRPRAMKRGRRVTAKAVGKSIKRLRRSHKAASHSRGETDYDHALHEVRKDAKRLRHVAESASLVHGKRARKVAKAAHRQQKALGDFQDAVVARALLASLDQELTATPAYRELLDLQDRLKAEARSRYRKARSKSRALLRQGV